MPGLSQYTLRKNVLRCRIVTRDVGSIHVRELWGVQNYKIPGLCLTGRAIGITPVCEVLESFKDVSKEEVVVDSLVVCPVSVVSCPGALDRS